MTMNSIFFVVIISFQLWTLISSQGGELCNMPDGAPGVCQVLPNCPSLLQLYQRYQGSREVINYLQQTQRNCGRRNFNRNPIVCCQDNVVLVPDDDDSPQIQTPPPTPPPTQPPQTPPPTPPPTQPPTSQPLYQQNCEDPNGIPGNCIGLKSCAAVLNEFLSRPKDPNYIKYIQDSNVKCNRVGQNICCPAYDSYVPPATLSPQTPPPTPPPTTPPTQPRNPNLGTRLLTPETGCGFSNITHNRIVGGEPAKLGTWPWMALIGYTDKLGTLSFKCGGSLISTRHVLTAAHCIRSTLTTCRLGEHNLEVDDETQHIDIPVVKVSTYPTYDKKDGHNDLAVLYLEKDVQFTNLIHPICIPFEEPLKSKDFENYRPFVAGWGRTQEGGKSANILQELQLPVLNNQKCAEKYKAQGKLLSDKQFDNAVLCAGYLQGGQDSCQGDSGGPLMSPTIIQDKTYFYQIGIVSYGIGCARANVPGVYARVQTFTNWIAEQVAQPIE